MLKSPLVRIPLRYGLIGGVIGCMALAVLYAMGRHPFLLPIIVDFRIIIYAIFIFMALKETRDQHLGGNLFFWQAMMASYVFIGTAAVMGTLFTIGLATWSSGFVPEYISVLQQQLVTFKAQVIGSVGAEAYAQQLSKLPQTTGWDLAGDYFLKSMIIGLILSISISVILRKQNQTQ